MMLISNSGISWQYHCRGFVLEIYVTFHIVIIVKPFHCLVLMGLLHLSGSLDDHGPRLRDEDDEILQFAIRQSLVESGTEDEQVICFSI